MITNGIPLTREIIDMLLSYNNFKVLAISVDNIKKKINTRQAKLKSLFEEGLDLYQQKEWQKAKEKNMKMLIKL